jgi:hypothetical protein
MVGSSLVSIAPGKAVYTQWLSATCVRYYHGMDGSLDVARELVYAYTDALESGDADAEAYATEQIDAFIDEIGDDSDSAPFVELLDLPLNETTLALLSEVGGELRRRGPAVVEALLAAAVGDGPPDLSVSDVLSVAGAVGALLEALTRYPDTPPRVENALAVLKGMDRDDLILGLIEVLEGKGDDRLKQAAYDTLVEIGGPALDELRLSLKDRDAKPWVVEALGEIEARPAGTTGVDRERPGGAAPEDWLEPASAAPEDWAEPADEDVNDVSDAAVDEDVEPDEAADEPADGDMADADGSAEAADTAPGVPDDGRLDDEYKAFLERFKRETGQR